MGDSSSAAAAFHTALNSVQALGRGFDVNFDTRLLYCKGPPGSRIVEIDEDNTWDLELFGNLVVPNVSRDIARTRVAAGRESYGVSSFDEHIDAAATKSLSMDGFFVPLVKVKLAKSVLVLKDYVKKSSPLSVMEMKSYVQHIGNQRFSDTESLAFSGPLRPKDKGGDSGLFNSQGIYPQPSVAQSLEGKEDDLERSHKQWARTVQSLPDIIGMAFIPITDLVEDIAGKEHLTRAISAYLDFKPQIEELRYFLEFQVPRVWAPLQDRLPGHNRKGPVCPSLQFSLMGQKLYVCKEQVSVGRKPVTGLRLCLEGQKQNRLCIHVQHLASLPKVLIPHWDSQVPIGAPNWRGPEEQDSRWFEPIKWKNFSNVSTAPIEIPETNFENDVAGVHIVTGAQLGVWDFGSRNVLYMKLLYSKLPGCTIRRSLWDHRPDEKLKVQLGSGDTGFGVRESVTGNKLVKFVDTAEMSKGPQDLPGHWLVTGGKQGVEKGKIVLRVKYSLLNY
ncbi:MACPF domain-containing protein [Drosera capensis]